MPRPFGRIVSLLLLMLVAVPAAAREPAPAVVVLQSKGFVHDVVKEREGKASVVEEVLAELAGQTGEQPLLAPRFTRDASTLTADSLREAELVIFYTTGDDLPLDVEALNAWVREGGAILGIHCATDTLKNEPRFRDDLLGAAFLRHPWNAGDTVTIRADDPDHPAAKPYAPSATFPEEIYQFRSPLPEDAHVILSLDRERTEKKIEGEGSIPIAWQREVGKGRVFYTSLGHREDVWRSEAFQAHLLAAIGWLLEPEAEPAGAAGGPPVTDALPTEKQAESSGRPREPWVFRSILDGNTRMIAVALHEDLWLAYDPKTFSLYQAWKGGVELRGAVYDGRHGPQPVSKQQHLYAAQDLNLSPWRLVAGTAMEPTDVEATLRYRGYAFDGGRVNLAAELRGGGATITIRESPEFQAESGHVALARRFTVAGLPAGHELVAALPAAEGATTSVASEDDAATVASASGQFAEHSSVLRIRKDGTFTVTTSWPAAPQGAATGAKP